MTPIVPVTMLIVVGMHLISAQNFQYTNIPPVIIYGDGSSSCPSEQQRASTRQEIQEKVASTLGLQPPHRCGAGEWIRVAYLNMKDPSQTCPSAWREINDTTNRVRVCGRPQSSFSMCHGSLYSTGGRTFTKVCGRVIGYQIGHPDAFHSFSSINFPYVEGVSITYGNPRTHIWTYAAALSELNNDCPCANNRTSTNPPSFVGNNYYCESGNKNSSFISNFLYADDPLWDGEDCSTEGTCCSDIDGQFPPWFSVPLNNPTNSNIEVRICADSSTSEDTPIELLEIYIQ